MTLELAELDSTALHTELGQLDETLLKTAASSLELSTAQLCTTRKLQQPLWAPAFDRWAPRGSAESRASLSQLDLDQLELPHSCGSNLPTGASLEKEASPLSLAKILFAAIRPPPKKLGPLD